MDGNKYTELTELALQLQKITKSFTEEPVIGRGGYGEVYKGLRKNRGVFAVKRLRNVDLLDENQLQDEVSNLKKLNHVNSIRLLGYCYDCHETEKITGVYDEISPFAGRNRFLSFEYMHNGSLQNHLSDESSELDWESRYKIIKGVCEGLKILHGNMWPKITDFGLSRMVGEKQTWTTQSPLGTIGYWSPEYIEKGEASRKADVFSLGVVTIRLLTLGHGGYPNYLTMPTDEFIDQKDWRNKLQKTFATEPLLEIYCGQVAKCIDIALKCMEKNSPWDVEFTVAASAKGGIEIKIGSHVIHVPKYLSVHLPIVQMMVFARSKFADTFACLKSLAPKTILDMVKRLCSSAWTNVCEADWMSARPKSESPKKRRVSGFEAGKNIGRRKEPTENQSQHRASDPDSSRAERGIKAVERKAPAAWVLATGAPQHVTGNRDLLSGFITKHNDVFVHAVDGVPMKVLARGAVVTDAVVLPNVWFVPGLTLNLVSASQLAELDYSIGFGCGQCCISANGKIVGKGHLQEGGLYVLDYLKVPLAI